MKHNHHSGKEHSGRFFGFILITIGVLWLLNRMHITFIPEWVISAPTILIVLGLMISIKTRFRRLGPVFLMLLGVIWLIRKHDLIPTELSYLFWPLMVIGMGIFILFRPKRTKCGDSRFIYSESDESYDRKDSLDIDSVFCGSKKHILSKDFKGGSINVIFGGTELNLSQADFEKLAVIDVNIIFGGLKIIIPNNWELKTQLTTIAAGVEDKRSHDGLQVVPDKTLILKGTILFGGVDIQNY